MVRTILTSLFLLLVMHSVAADDNYSIKNVPENLLKDAHAVKRSELKEFTINNTRSTKMRHQYAITILNENGNEHAGLVVFYDKLTKVNSIKGTLYNATGIVLKKLKTKDILDLSAVDDNNLAEDSRMKTHDFNYKDYPYTVEYEIETENNHTFLFPAWIPQQGENFSVQQSTYSIIYPENYKIRYKAFNYVGKPEESAAKGKVMMKWQAVSLPAIKVPFAISSWADLATVVYFAPSDFEIGGYTGNLSTWDGFGQFQQSLNKGRDVLPEVVTTKVQKLITGVTDEKEKIKILYQYLQQNTRYISIQLGVGGWQPFEAAYVAKNGYGDCKALTNYMQSLLKSAGIDSYYTIIFAGASAFAQNRFVEDLPSQQFNHVVLCVPGDKDTTWLECTSQNAPAGYMGNFTGNRKAILVNDRGARIVSTPRYGLKENKQTRKIHAQLTTDGTLAMNVSTVYECIQQEGISGMIQALSDEKIKEFLQKSLPLSTYDINDFKYAQTKSALPSVQENLDVTVHNFATITGKRIFLVPNLLNRSGTQHTLDTSRKTDFVFTYAYQDSDEIEFSIPSGYTLEAGVKDVSIKTDFGKYEIVSRIENNKIIYKRTREQYSGRFPVNMQTEIIQFYKDIYQSDRKRIVLVKKD